MRDEERIADLSIVIRTALDAQQAGIWTAMPAIVDAVDFDKQAITAQIAIECVWEDAKGKRTYAPYPPLVDVPIVWPRAGGFALTFPIKKGDEVLIVFASRCIDSWWQNGGVQVPAEIRFHDLSDGFAIPGPTSQPKKLNNVSAQNVQLRTDDGGTYLEITPSGDLNIKAGTARAYGKGIAVDGENIELVTALKTYFTGIETACKGNVPSIVITPLAGSIIGTINTAKK